MNNTTMIISFDEVNGETILVAAINSESSEANTMYYEMPLPLTERDMDWLKERTKKVGDVFKSSSLDFPEEYGATKADAAMVLKTIAG